MLKMSILFSVFILFFQCNSFEIVQRMTSKMRCPRDRYAFSAIAIAENLGATVDEANVVSPVNIDIAINDVQVKSKSKPKPKPRAKKVEKPREIMNNFNYTDSTGTYDVPFLEEPMWFRASVRKGSEKKMADTLKELCEEPQWKNILFDAYCPLGTVPKLKGKNIVASYKPSMPGTIYVKTKMSPDIADDLEQIDGFYGFPKNLYRKVLPIDEEHENELEIMRNMTANEPIIDPEIAKIKKEDYVTIVSGLHAGKYGILMGAKGGKFEVRMIHNLNIIFMINSPLPPLLLSLPGMPKKRPQRYVGSLLY